MPPVTRESKSRHYAFIHFCFWSWDRHSGCTWTRNGQMKKRISSYYAIEYSCDHHSLHILRRSNRLIKYYFYFPSIGSFETTSSSINKMKLIDILSLITNTMKLICSTLRCPHAEVENDKIDYWTHHSASSIIISIELCTLLRCSRGRYCPIDSDCDISVYLSNIIQSVDPSIMIHQVCYEYNSAQYVCMWGSNNLYIVHVRGVIWIAILFSYIVLL